ncbi:MAG: cupin-like domain-containing protein [Bosea sp. (in: a-proteobacteria)]
MAERRPGIFEAMQQLRVLALRAGESIDERLKQESQPFVIRGLVNDWPLVKAGKISGRAARDYLLAHHQDRPFTVAIGPDHAEGRLFYNDDMSMNVSTGRAKLPDIFRQIERSESQPVQPIVYVASIDVETYFSGLHAANHVDLGDRSCLASLWMGTRSRIAAHNDFPNNLACVVAGRRRFTLFPPEQFRNLYLGPIDNTPAGRAVSMVDFHAPDLRQYPRFPEALEAAQFAELEPGDAIYIPSMWWHHVEGLDPFNVLLNYWWRETPRHLGQPQDALNHAIMAIRDLPATEKQLWRALFDHYVFENDADVVAHIPEAARSVLGPMTAENAAKIRTFLLGALSR